VCASGRNLPLVPLWEKGWNFNWNCIEHDSLEVKKETSLPGNQTIHRKLKAFDKKLLNRQKFLRINEWVEVKE